MKYDSDKFTRLGVGETVSADCFVMMQQPDESWTDPAGVVNSWIGHIVHEADEECGQVFFRINKTEFHTGATRSDATGRGRFDLIPYEAMLSLARRYELGALHFGDRNWEKGQPLSRLLSSMRRHSHQIGYDYSEDHVGAVLWNAAAFTAMVERMRAGILSHDLDDIGFFANEEASQP